jgi:hypothetical protein
MALSELVKKIASEHQIDNSHTQSCEATAPGSLSIPDPLRDGASARQWTETT